MRSISKRAASRSSSACCRPANRSRVAKEKGFEVYTPAEAVKRADVIMVALPDTKQAAAFEKDIRPNLTKGQDARLQPWLFHSLQDDRPPKDVNIIMVAPKGPGHIVRRQYTEGKASRRSSPSTKTLARTRRRSPLRGRRAFGGHARRR